MTFGDAIAAVVQNVALPYGYTLSVWSAGVMAVYAYGAPRKRETLLFVVGAVLGFLVFDIPTYRVVSDEPQLNVPVPSVALLNIFPLLAVGASSLLIRRVASRWIGYFLSGFMATVVYITSLGLMIWLLS